MRKSAEIKSHVKEIADLKANLLLNIISAPVKLNELFPFICDVTVCFRPLTAVQSS